MIKFLITLFLLIFNYCIAQSPVYTTLGEETFWNKDIYTILYEEETEVIYVGTNSGLFIYKENSFIQLQGPSNQIGLSFFNLQKDKKGKVFCNNLNGQIFRINPEKNSYELYHQLSSKNTKGGQLWCYFTPENNLFIASKFYSVILNPEKEIIDTNLGLDNKTIGQIVNVQQLNNRILIELYKNNNSNKLYLYEYSLSKLSAIKSIISYSYQTSSGFMMNKSQVFSLNKMGTINYAKSIVQDFSPQEMERYSNLSDSCIIALNPKNGFRFIFLENDTLKASPLKLPNTFISAHYQTKSGQFIFGTFGDGIMVVSDPNIQKYEHDYLFLDIAVSPANKVALCTRSGEVLLTDQNHEIRQISQQEHHIDHVFHIGNNNALNNLGYKEFAFADKDKIGVEIKDLKIISDDLVMISRFSGVQTIMKNQKALIGNDLILKGERYESLEWDPVDSLIYYSTNLGVFSKNWKKDESEQLFFRSEPFTVNDLAFWEDLLFCGTNHHGVLIYKDQKLIDQINFETNLRSEMIRQILILKSRLYILTNKGLKLYDLKKKEYIKIQNESLYERVTKMALSKDKLWLLEKHGYFSVDLSTFENPSNKSDSLKIFINDIQVNNASINFEPHSTFSYDENRFEFTYDYRQIFNKSKTKIFYKLEGLNKNWKRVSPTKNKILFQSLPNGNYNFKIKAEYHNSKSETLVFPFKISPPFWQTWWFYLSLIIVAIILVSFYFNLRIRKIKKEDEARLEKHKLLTHSIDAELKAIRAQMNPHFIFNAINSIQDLVLQNDTLKSYDALVQFSKLVRNTLDYSEKEYIYLSQEIEFLETYLGLEKLRFKTNFSYSIENTIDKDLSIPSIIIQPFIENAIKHGLLHKSGQRELKIKFYQVDKQVICLVSDNGIGIAKSKEIKSRQKLNHNSFSTNAIAKRLEILSQRIGQKCHYSTSEIQDNSGLAIGTEVKVILPLID